MSNRTAERFKLLSLSDLFELPDPTWLIEGMLPANAFCMLYGEPGCGKTFVALSMGLSIAAGHRWCGKVTTLGSVLYVAAEGLFGLKLRVGAYQTKHGISFEGIRYLGDAFNLRNALDIHALSAALQTAEFAPDLIILDTLARVTPGADENSAKEMGEAVAMIDWLRQRTSASVLLVHHTGKSGKSERGSSALRGARCCPSSEILRH